MTTNYQHRWGQTEERIRASRKRQPTTTTPSALVVGTCPACGHQQSAGRLADYGCGKCRLTALALGTLAHPRRRGLIAPKIASENA